MRKSNEKNVIKRNNGITLIALVITIIVLLILAGVTIATLTGDNGILTKAKEAKDFTNDAKKDEQEKINQIADFMASDTYDVTKVNDNTPGTLDGNGSQNNPYTIESIEDLMAFSNEVNAGNDFEGQYVSLGISLDFNSNNSYENPDTKEFGDINENGIVETLKEELTTKQGFIPIGNYNVEPIPFSGIFMGNNKTIRNLYMDIQKAEGETDGGLFGYNTGTIQDVYIQNCNLNVQDYIVLLGGICGVNNGKILRSSVTGKIKAYSTGIFEALNGVGGITGNCPVDGEQDILIESCYNFAEILSVADEEPRETSYVCNCNVGGISGSIQNASAYISNCYNRGNVKVETKQGYNIGGIAGSSGGVNSELVNIPGVLAQDIGGNINNSYNAGNISATGIKGYIGSAVGYIDGNTTMKYVYAIDDYDFIGEINETEEYPNSITDSKNKTAEELKTEDILLLLGDKFKIDSRKNEGYPILIWQ